MLVSPLMPLGGRLGFKECGSRVDLAPFDGCRVQGEYAVLFCRTRPKVTEFCEASTPKESKQDNSIRSDGGGPVAGKGEGVSRFWSRSSYGALLTQQRQNFGASPCVICITRHRITRSLIFSLPYCFLPVPRFRWKTWPPFSWPEGLASGWKQTCKR